MTNEYNNLIDKYKAENEIAATELKQVRQKIHQLGTAKLAVFVGGIAAVVMLRHGSYWAVGGAALAAIVLFMLLAVWQDQIGRASGRERVLSVV